MRGGGETTCGAARRAQVWDGGCCQRACAGLALSAHNRGVVAERNQRARANIRRYASREYRPTPMASHVRRRQRWFTMFDDEKGSSAMRRSYRCPFTATRVHNVDIDQECCRQSPAPAVAKRPMPRTTKKTARAYEEDGAPPRRCLRRAVTAARRAAHGRKTRAQRVVRASPRRVRSAHKAQRATPEQRFVLLLFANKGALQASSMMAGRDLFFYFSFSCSFCRVFFFSFLFLSFCFSHYQPFMHGTLHSFIIIQRLMSLLVLVLIHPMQSCCHSLGWHEYTEESSPN